MWKNKGISQQAPLPYSLTAPTVAQCSKTA